MGKAVKNKGAKPKKDIIVKTNLTPDELFKMAINTPIKKKGKGSK